MENREEIERIAKRLTGARPHPKFNMVDETNKGLGFTLRYLAEADGPVTPGEIARAAGVSTARIAVVIRQLVDKGMISREMDPKDVRKVRISLTDKGKAFIGERANDFLNMVSAVVDEVGIDVMYSYLDAAEKIFGAMDSYMQSQTLPEIK